MSMDALPGVMLPGMFEDDAFGEERLVVDRYTAGFSGRQLPSAPDERELQHFLGLYDICRCCEEHVSRCKTAPRPPPQRQRLLGPRPRPASTTLGTLQQGKSNADPRQGNKDKMESSTDAGAIAMSATAVTTTLQEVPDLRSANGIVQPEGQTNADLPSLEQERSYSDTPLTPHPVGQVQQRDASGTRPETPNTERAANILANVPIHVPEAETTLAVDSMTAAMGTNAVFDQGNNYSFPGHQHGADVESWSIEDSELFDSQNAQGFAKLMFPDGDYIVTTHDVQIGRNMEVASSYKKEQKDLKRAQQREQRKERVQPAQKVKAQRELQQYQQEPSQPSLPGDDGQQADASNSSHSLEGRPAPQSTFSEAGGALAFAQDSDEEAEVRRGRRRRRNMQQSKSSTSTTSVVPANLHPPVMTAEYSQRELFAEDGEPYSRTLAILPVHTQRPEDITKISKKHLVFSFNFPEERWELKVFGNRAYVNGGLFDRGETLLLGHNDEIQISSVTITFKLPDTHRHSPGLSRGTFSQVGLEDVDDLSADDYAVAGTSPVRRLSNAFEEAACSDDEPVERRQGVPKLKLKSAKKVQKEKKAPKAKPNAQEDEKAAPKISIKKQQRRRSDDSPSPDADKKAGKGKKPKEASKQPPEPKVEQSIEVPPAAPVFTAEPGSALASVPLDELPQKRKGPGRPPKNGLVSKRDQALVRKKERDFEKAGLAPPPFNKILELVRAETKQKEMQAKMQSGTLPPGTEMPPPVETDLAAAAVKAPAAPAPADFGDQPEGLLTESTRRPSSPRPKRVARSPSPMKPATAYTEEELKKPSATYVHILDEVLRDHPSGQADLQEIYDRIQKRYPHYKYGVNTQGWQSSVRHNLLSAPRFKETGRSGKGKLWTIDYDVPLEREKKKKATPPPRPPPMMNGQYMAYGQQPYANGYGPPANGQRPVNGGPGYYPPYQHGQHPSGPNMPNRQGPSPGGQTHPNGSQAQQQPDPFGGLVPEILALRNAFLVPYVNEPNMQSKSEWIGKCVTVFSDRFHGSGEQPDLPVETPEEQKAYAGLDAIFKKYEALKAKQQQEQQNTAGAPSVQPGPIPAQANNVSGMSQPGPSPQQQQQTVQTAVADGVAYQNANGGVSPTTSPAVAARTGQSQTVAQPAPPGQIMAPAFGYPGNGPPPPRPSVQGMSLSETVRMEQAAAAAAAAAGASPPVVGNTTPYPPPPPQRMPSVPQLASPQSFSSRNTPAPNRAPSAHYPYSPSNVPSGSTPTPSNGVPSAQPPVNSVPAQRPPQPQSDAKPTGLAPPVSQPLNGAPTQSPSQQQVKVETTASAPPVQHTTESTGTKRAAEDDAAAESDAKRTKMDE